MTAQRILIIDDEPAIRQVLEQVFSKASYEVTGVGSAEEGLHAFASNPFDLLVVDKNLPQMSGIEFIREIRNQGGDAAVILVTGFASVESAVSSLELDVDAYIEKPFGDLNLLLERAERALEKYAARKNAANAAQRLKQATAMLESVAQATHGVPLRALIASPHPRECAWLEGHIKEIAEKITMVSSPEKALREIRHDVHHILVLDSALGWPTLLKGVRTKIENDSPAVFILVANENPSLDVLKKLIDANVRTLLQRPVDDDALHSAAMHAARRARTNLREREVTPE